MLQLGDRIRGMFNGGAEAAGVEGLTAAIADLEKQASEARAELATVPAQRQALLIADDERELDKLEKRETELYRAVEKLTAAVPKIRQRLTELQAVAKKAAVARHRKNIEAHADALENAVSAAITANLAAESAREAARRELGDGVMNMVIPDIHYPGFLTKMAFETWRAWIHDALAKSPREWPRPVLATRSAIPMTAAESIAPGYVKIPHAEIVIGKDGFKNGPQGEVWPSGHRVSVPVEWAKRMVMAGQATYALPKASGDPATNDLRRQRRRAPIRDELREGERLVTILRDNYNDPAGRQLLVSDVISLPLEIAERVVCNGAGEFCGEGARP